MDRTNISRRGFVTAAVAGAWACANDRTGSLLVPNLSLMVPANSVTLAAPTGPLPLGSMPTITGTVRDGAGRAMPREPISVEDGIGGHTTAITTSTNGLFSYRPRVAFADLCVFSVILRGERFPFLFQAARQVLRVSEADSAQIRGVVIDNRTTRDAKVTLTGPRNQITRAIAKRNARTQVIKHDASATPRFTAQGGVRLAATVVSPADSIDASGIHTVMFTGVPRVLLGKVYAKDSVDLGACWSPRAESGVLRVNIGAGAELCWGKSGFRVAAVTATNAPARAVTGSIKLQVTW